MVILEDDGEGGVLIHVKAVPGAARSEIAGILGDRLKVRLAAPAENGKANAALCTLIAETLGIRPGAVEVVRGTGAPNKVVRARGVGAREARGRLGLNEQR